MLTQCKPLSFASQGCQGRKVTAAFDGGSITSNAEALLLGKIDRALGFFDRVAGCFTDHRDPRLTEHSVRTLVAQRITGIALGHEDLNDHDELRRDPLLSGKLEGRRKGCAPLAGKSTLSRLEHAHHFQARIEEKAVRLDEGSPRRRRRRLIRRETPGSGHASGSESLPAIGGEKTERGLWAGRVAVRSSVVGTGRGPVGKTAVVAAKGRETKQVVAKVIDRTDGEALWGFVDDHATPHATLYTDDATAYKGSGWEHERVKHSAAEYVRYPSKARLSARTGWRAFGRCSSGRPRASTASRPSTFQAYVNTFAARQNIRELDTLSQMVVGRRLAWTDGRTVAWREGHPQIKKPWPRRHR